MKLVEIKDVRVGQIYKTKRNELALVTISHYNDAKVYPLDPNDEFKHPDIIRINGIGEKDLQLIGFLGITHEINGDNLVEIPRKDFEVDDAIHLTSYAPFIETGVQVIQDIYELENYDPKIRYSLINKDGSSSNNWCMENLKKAQIKKIGILGVTHEFVNKRLVK